MTDVIEGFRKVEVPGAPWPVYRDGTGPNVILLHELMGLTAPALQCARRVVDAGFTVWLPVLAGPAPADTGAKRLRALAGICVSREIRKFKTGETSPIVAPLRDLARHAGGKVGVIGMCFSGGFALALAAEEPVRAGVAAQPSLPYANTPFTRGCARDLGLSPHDEERLAERLRTNETGIYVTRFAEDRTSPAERAGEIERRLGVTVDEVPSWRKGDHSVLAVAPRDYAKDPEKRARLDETMDRVLAFLTDRLS